MYNTLPMTIINLGIIGIDDNTGKLDVVMIDYQQEQPDLKGDSWSDFLKCDIIYKDESITLTGNLYWASKISGLLDNQCINGTKIYPNCSKFNIVMKKQS